MATTQISVEQLKANRAKVLQEKLSKELETGGEPANPKLTIEKARRCHGHHRRIYSRTLSQLLTSQKIRRAAELAEVQFKLQC